MMMMMMMISRVIGLRNGGWTFQKQKRINFELRLINFKLKLIHFELKQINFELKLINFEIAILKFSKALANIPARRCKCPVWPRATDCACARMQISRARRPRSRKSWSPRRNSALRGNMHTEQKSKQHNTISSVVEPIMEHSWAARKNQITDPTQMVDSAR